jgi:HSP20 family protein
MLVRFQRYPILSLQKEIDKMFNNAFTGDMQDDGTLFSSSWTPVADVAEYANEYVVQMELPGVSKEDVKITIEENMLTIQGEKKHEKETKEPNFHRTERSYGSFQRSFTLPKTVKTDEIGAAYTDGILNITIPKADEVKPKQIDIKIS